MSLAQYLLDIIFPPACLACKKYLKNDLERSRHLCPDCSEKLVFLPGFLCPVCSRRYPIGGDSPAGECHKDAQFVLAAPLSYGNPVVRELIQALKYGGLKTAAEPLASVLAEYLRASILNSKFQILDSIIIPIPLHPSKEKKRGFNQALVIAEKLKNSLKIDNPLLTDVLIKVKSTPSQTEKNDYEAREENVRGSFRVEKPGLISHKDIFLVDDVFTSGATMREAARALKSAGAGKIIGLVIARA